MVVTVSGLSSFMRIWWMLNFFLICLACLFAVSAIRFIPGIFVWSNAVLAKLIGWDCCEELKITFLVFALYFTGNQRWRWERPEKFHESKSCTKENLSRYHQWKASRKKDCYDWYVIRSHWSYNCVYVTLLLFLSFS